MEKEIFYQDYFWESIASSFIWFIRLCLRYSIWLFILISFNNTFLARDFSIYFSMTYWTITSSFWNGYSTKNSMQINIKVKNELIVHSIISLMNIAISWFHSHCVSKWSLIWEVDWPSLHIRSKHHPLLELDSNQGFFQGSTELLGDLLGKETDISKIVAHMLFRVFFYNITSANLKYFVKLIKYV